MSGCGADVLAVELNTTLLAGKTFEIPDVDLEGTEYTVPAETGPLYEAVDRLNINELTTKVVGGTGSFDILMATVSAHLKDEFEKNRITGEQYSKTYIALTESALANGLQFLLGRDQAYWQAITAQLQAQTAQTMVVRARIELEVAKAQLKAVRFEALNNEANYALTKLKLASEDAQYCLLQAQKANVLAQTADTEKETEIKDYNLTNILPGQKLLLDAQVEAADIETDIKAYTLSDMLPEQKKLLAEQAEAQRAQTLDTRSDGVTPVTGTVGKQKDLYAQQITSYQRDAEVKVAKIFSDAWITMKTIDEGVVPPTGFANTSLDEILTKLKANTDLD